MTSMADCLQRAIDFGELDRARGVALIDEFNQLVARYRSMMPEAQAKARAAADLKEANKAKTARRRHIVLNQLQAMSRLRNTILTAKDPAAAIKGLLEYNPNAGSKSESVRSLAEAYVTSINAALEKVLKETGTNVVGNSRNPRLLENLIRELHDEATGDALAKALAKTVRDQQQRMRRAFNSYGGDIGDLADFGVSHSHDAGQLRLKGFDAWAAKIRPLLAWDRIIDNSTGKPFAARGDVPEAAQVETFLRDVYDGIITRGWDDRDPSLSMGGRALANQRAEHRVLHFRNGSAWIDYNREFGTSDPFSAMIGGLHGLAGDVALMRVLGPNPRMGLQYATQVAEKLAADIGDGRLAERAARAGNSALAMLAHQNGSANIPHHVGWARFFSGVRSTLVSIQLGSAVVSSVTDAATITAAAQTIGMSARNVMSRSVQLMASQATRETAARMGYVAETLADSGSTMARYFGKTFGTGLPDRMASFTLRATGLSAVTDFRKIAFQMEFAGHLADMGNRAWADMEPNTRMMLERRGITAADWDLMRDPSTRFYPKAEGMGGNGGPALDGPDFMTPHYWLETQTKLPRVEAEGLAMRWQMAIQEQLEMAIPSASLEGKAMLQGTSAPGTFLGELARSSTAYKSFSLSLMLNQYRRFAEADSWGMNRWSYAAKLSGMLLVLGGLAIQLKELVKGNDPRPMDEGKFWMAALFQGGGLGIFGDFFASETSRTGGGIGEALAGPVAGFAGDILGPVASNLTRAVNGEDTLIGRDVANIVRQNTPFFSSAWYMRTAYSRLVADNLQAFLDPEAELLFRRRVKRMAKDYGTQPFVPVRGTGQSFRLPDLSNALGSLGGDQ
jgi:hypothetical protein